MKNKKNSTTRNIDKERETQKHFQLTRPPRLEGEAKNAMMYSKRKEKKSKKKSEQKEGENK
ncbi:MAG: hypothetical protein HGA67_04190 [Candidatus Yonathbacteria bacterium]|nr:hypothetical protein [Candidatus Yonathbacteria bacterium]